MFTTHLTLNQKFYLAGLKIRYFCHQRKLEKEKRERKEKGNGKKKRWKGKAVP